MMPEKQFPEVDVLVVCYNEPVEVGASTGATPSPSPAKGSCSAVPIRPPPPTPLHGMLSQSVQRSVAPSSCPRPQPRRLPSRRRRLLSPQSSPPST
jgi:hypothetical protein